MAAVTVPSGRSLLGKIAVSAAARAVAGFAARLVRPHRAALANLASMPLTAAGLGCIDAGVFTVSTVAGWIITGLSLMFLEHLIADE